MFKKASAQELEQPLDTPCRPRGTKQKPWRLTTLNTAKQATEWPSSLYLGIWTSGRLEPVEWR